MKFNTFSRIAFLIIILIMQFSALQGQERKPGNIKNRSGEAIPEKLTPAQETAAEAYIRAQDQLLYEKLIKRKISQPQSYYKTLQRVFCEMNNLEETRKRDPEMFERLKKERQIDRETRMLANEIQSLEDAGEKARKKKELSDKLNELFNLRQENRLDEIKKLEQRILEIKENNAKRLVNKEAIVQRRLNELLGERDALDW